MTRIILDERDADQLLRILYNGTRPPRVHTLICACGAIADLRVSSSAWNGWQVLPYVRCPEHKELISASEESYPQLARERFMDLIDQMTNERLCDGN